MSLKMDIFTILFIAVGLSMDAFAVSIAQGFVSKQKRTHNALKLGLFFGLFQMIMPVAGWYFGTRLRECITGVDHWLSFALLGFIGAKMIYEPTKMKDSNEDAKSELSFYMLIVLSVATSIDALAAGLSLSFLNVPIVFPVAVIGVVTFCFSFAGVFIGERFGHFFERKIEIAGGLILIAIGLKILISHIYF